MTNGGGRHDHANGKKKPAVKKGKVKSPAKQVLTSVLPKK